MKRIRDHRLASLVAVSGCYASRLAPPRCRSSNPCRSVARPERNRRRPGMFPRRTPVAGVPTRPCADLLQRVVALAPRLPEAHVNTGFALPGLERYAAVRDSFRGDLKLRPRQVAACRRLVLRLEALCDLHAAGGAMRS